MITGRHAERNPFPQGYPDEYFFTTPALRLRLDLVREHIDRGDSPVLLLGESGAGKTTLLHQLVTRADNAWRIVRMPAMASFSAQEYATLFGEEIRLGSHDPDSNLLEELNRWLLRLHTRGQLTLVIVDNAHQLRDESLRFLAELPMAPGGANLRLLLTGEPTLRGRFRSAMSSAPVAGRHHVINIPSLDRLEVARYIDMRLYHAGLENGHRFRRSTVDDIARDSRGRPGRINAIAGRLLNGNGGVSQWRRGAELMRRLVRSWIPAAVLALGVTTVLPRLWHGGG